MENKSFASKTNKYLIHTILWILFITYKMVIIKMLPGVFDENDIIHFILSILFFYLHANLMDRVHRTDRRFDYFFVNVIVIGEVLTYVLLSILFKINTHHHHSFIDIDYYFVWSKINSCSFILLTSTAWWSANQYFGGKVQQENTEKHKSCSTVDRAPKYTALTKAKNSYLKAQINTHFIFNTLNFLKERVGKNDPAAGDLILLMSDIMRYGLELNNNDQLLVQLSKEIEQVENLINFFQVKEDYSLSVHFDYDDTVAEENFIPFSLLTLMENIFKHGVVNDHYNPAIMTLNIKDGFLLIKTENKIGNNANALSLEIGLTNLQERLTNTYGNNCHFFYGTKGSSFHAEIKVRIDLPYSPIILDM